MIRRKRNEKGMFTSDIVSIFIKNGEKYKICTLCKKEKKLSEFYNINKKNTTTSRCKKCTDETNKKYKHKYDNYFKNYREAHKKEIKEKSKKYHIKKRKEWIEWISTIIDIKCQKCGYDKMFEAMDFHHINPNEKENQMWKLMKQKINDKRKKKFKNELKKCILLCSRCHREEHVLMEKNKNNT